MRRNVPQELQEFSEQLFRESAAVGMQKSQNNPMQSSSHAGRHYPDSMSALRTLYCSGENFTGTTILDS
jgi:hypothetical protein